MFERPGMLMTCVCCEKECPVENHVHLVEKRWPFAPSKKLP